MLKQLDLYAKYQFYINDILTIIEKYIMELKNFPNS